MIGLMEGLRENLDWLPKYQAYLRERRPPTLIVWGLRMATCLRMRHETILEICLRLNSISWTADIGYWKHTRPKSLRLLGFRLDKCGVCYGFRTT